MKPLRFISRSLMRRLAGLTPLLVRTALISAALAAPVLALPVNGDAGTRIEAPASKNSGIGFVLLVSLQRG